jgi:hypothetical protein
MYPCPSPRSALLRGRITIVAIATAIGFLTFAGASLAATGSVYVDGNFDVAAGHDFFGGATPANGGDAGLGYAVFPNLTTGADDTALGIASLRADESGGGNTASGFFALARNDAGNQNTADGSNALDHNTNGSQNVAVGQGALHTEKSGSNNLATGFAALRDNTSGSTNVAVGAFALCCNLTSSNNIAIGVSAGGSATGSNNIDIGNTGASGDGSTIRIGDGGAQKRTFIAGIHGASVGGSGEPVLIRPNGQLGTESTAKFADGTDVARLRAQNRRQAAEIAGLKREVAKLAKR